MREFKVEKDFIENGYRCIIVGAYMGTRCGYVGLPRGHKFYGVEYDAIDVDVHGGLTYSSRSCTYPVPLEEDMWWIGFDCAHCGDAKDFNLVKELNDEATYKILYDMENMFDTGGTIRSIEYVEKQLVEMVRQISHYIITIK